MCHAVSSQEETKRNRKRFQGKYSELNLRHIDILNQIEFEMLVEHPGDV